MCTLGVAVLASLAAITAILIAINIAYLELSSNNEIAASGEFIGAGLFKKLFEYHFDHPFLALYPTF